MPRYKVELTSVAHVRQTRIIKAESEEEALKDAIKNQAYWPHLWDFEGLVEPTEIKKDRVTGIGW